MKFRSLTADDVECRVGTITPKGLSLLLYKDARVDMNLLDENIGSDNWQRRHYSCKDTLFCSIGIRCGDEWIWKDDAGSESNVEKEKGEASDSFKRAGTNWGIGRELYSAPFIWVPATDKDGKDNYEITEKNNKLTTHDNFTVTYMSVVNGIITSLNIENPKKRKTVFVFGNIEPPPAEKTTRPCEICGKAVGKALADREMKQHGHVYCSAECHQKIDEMKG